MLPFTPEIDFSFGLVFRNDWKRFRVLDFIREQGRVLLQGYPGGRGTG